MDIWTVSGAPGDPRESVTIHADPIEVPFDERGDIFRELSLLSTSRAEYFGARSYERYKKESRAIRRPIKETDSCDEKYWPVKRAHDVQRLVTRAYSSFFRKT